MKLPSPDTKMGRVLAALLDGKSYNRFEAERWLHDHCLNSTVADLQIAFHIKIFREFETVPGYNGNPIRCCRYWIEPDEIRRINDEAKRLKKEAPTTSDQTNEQGFASSKLNHSGQQNALQSQPAM